MHGLWRSATEKSGCAGWAHLINVVPKILGYLKLSVTISRNNDCNVDITVGIGIALAIGTEHQYARLHDVETWTYHCLVAASKSFRSK